jgi:hypothetical protein
VGSILVSLTNEVVGEAFDGLRRVSGLDVLAIMANEDGLLRLNDNDTSTALAQQNTC